MRFVFWSYPRSVPCMESTTTLGKDAKISIKVEMKQDSFVRFMYLPVHSLTTRLRPSEVMTEMVAAEIYMC